METMESLKNAYDLVQSGQWLQLEGAIGRHCNGIIESGIIEIDKASTKKLGPIGINTVYGYQETYRFKFNEDKAWDYLDEQEFYDD